MKLDLEPVPSGGRVLVVSMSTLLLALLVTIGAAQRVSETTAPVFQPRGAIIGDRLNILWEDRRDGVSDIYGRSLELSRVW